MKSVFEHIAAKSRAFNERPLFTHLRDTSIDPCERLRFVPFSAHFILTFADLSHFFFMEPAPRDRYEELINIQLSEEASHWKWFLADLTTLGHDPTLRFTDALRFVWSDATVKTRKLAYDICRLSAGLSSLEKLVLVHTLEATGRVAFEAAVPAGRAAGAQLKRNLVFFGPHHLEMEMQHTLEDEDTHKELESIAIDEPMRARLFAVVDRVFDSFNDFVDESYECAKSGRGFEKVNTEAHVA
ncbi:MAG: hypothetical protein BGO98_30370 [Myxococcales bacterium 68-20]|nr:MAG: hypothetical protein BGO98_30370 [Myxococcales bacterium 68-20]